MSLYTRHLTYITPPYHTLISHANLYRRLVKRIYVPLPDPLARRALIKHLILKHHAAHSTSSSSSGPSSTKASPDKTTTTNSTAITTTNNTTVAKKNDKVMNKLTSLILGADSRSTTAATSGSSPSPAEDGICGFSGADLTRIVELTEGYSGSDLSAVSACPCVHEGAICLFV